MITIGDVAKRAGVSKSTVSNVFSKKRPISKEVTERVLQIAKELNYKPNYWARTLTYKKTNIIGIKMQGEKVKFSQFHLTLLNGVLEACYEHGYRLLVNTLSPVYKDSVEQMSSDPIDGEILLDPEIDDVRIVERLAHGQPIVVIGRPPDKYETVISYVDNDNVLTAYRVTEYLLELGHRHILFLNAPRHRTVAEDREKGYRQAIAMAGMKVKDDSIHYKDDDIHSTEYGCTVLKRLFAAGQIPYTAVITDTDKVALGVYQAAEELGIDIPSQLSVFAFSDDSVFAPEFQPPLSGVRLNGDDLGSEAVKLLIRKITETDTRATRVLVPAVMMIRGSCAPIINNHN